MRPHLLNLPLETRRQILFEALMCEIEERHPYPLGRKSLPFDRQLHPIFSRVEVVKLEKQVWGRPSFWGKEPMTRLMRANKQLYEEVYQILWSDFALHVASLNALHETAVLDWLETYNPRAFDRVRHLHIRWEFPPDSPPSRWDYDRDRIMRYICSFPGVVSIRFQIYLYGGEDKDTAEAKSTATERILRLVALCGELDVKISWEPNSEWPGWKKIIDQCIEKIGQDQRLPPLYQEHLQSWPTERAYITPTLQNERADTPPPSVEEFRSWFTPEYALQKWPKADRSKS